MSKKKLKLILLGFILVMVSFLGYAVISKIQEKGAVANRIKTIPEFNFKTLDNNTFTLADLKPNTATIFIYFSSACDYCQYEAQSISDNLDSFKNIQFILVSTEPIGVIQQFSEYYKLNNQENVTFLWDNLNTFSSQFDAKSIPHILIYNNKQKLIKKHKGQLNAKGILSALNKDE